MPGTNRETTVERIPFAFALQKNSEFEAGKFSGVASVWGSPIDTLWNIGARTKFQKGSFLKTINDSANRMKILAFHDQESMWVGLPTKLQETDEGLYIEASLNNTQAGKDMAEAMRHAASLGKLDALELSIGFDPVQHAMCEDEDDGEMFRVITEARLWEVSIVAFGADRMTRVVEAASLNHRLLPKADRESVVAWALTTLKALREGAAPFKEHAPLTEAQRKQLTEELALHAPVEPPSSALTDYEKERRLIEIEIAEAEAAFEMLAI